MYKEIPVTNKRALSTFHKNLPIRKPKNECWEWQGYFAGNGYGWFMIKGKRYLAHRFSYRYFNGSLSRDMVIDHICSNRKCINPRHLQETTILENIDLEYCRRGVIGRTRECSKYSVPTLVFDGICVNGHKITSFNDVRAYQKEPTYYWCRECETERKNRLRHD